MLPERRKACQATGNSVSRTDVCMKVKLIQDIASKSSSPIQCETSGTCRIDCLWRFLSSISGEWPAVLDLLLTAKSVESSLIGLICFLRLMVNHLTSGYIGLQSEGQEYFFQGN